MQMPRGAVIEQKIEFQSKLVGKKLPYEVLLPPDYEQSPKTHLFPTLYLLHGLFGHYDNWVKNTKLTEYAARHHLIIVTPEGNNGWYTDAANAPNEKYESYIIQELIPDVESRFRAAPSRASRGVAGLSMGGYGALKFGLKYPDKFAFAASFSGALGAGEWTEKEIGRFGPAVTKQFMDIFGDAGSQTRAANDIYKILRDMPNDKLSQLPYFYLDCGTEDGLLIFSRRFDDILLERKIPHEYRELPGKHDWKFWDSQIRDVLRIAEERTSAFGSGKPENGIGGSDKRQ